MILIQISSFHQFAEFERLDEFIPKCFSISALHLACLVRADYTFHYDTVWVL